jgi:hypothetical protein
MRLNLGFGVLSLALTVGMAAATGVQAVPVAGATAAAAKITYLQYMQGQVKGMLDGLQSNNDWNAASKGLDSLFDQAVLYSTEEHPEALREVDLARRMVSQLSKVAESSRMDLLKILRGSPNLASTLVFLIQPGDDVAGIYGMLDRLRQKRIEQLDKYATLAAAICVVHYKPFDRHINENTAKSADAIDLFDYYVKNESRMFFGIRNVPAELLVYVVDTTGTIEEMNWALNKYAGDREVGRRFFDIKYDYDHFRKGTPKKVTVAGFNVPNILQYGGVCADQAYFAMEVGKSIGVPTAYTVGQSGEVGHAWVGFLQNSGTSGWWNFDSGRYEAYRGVRGNVMDPQTRKDIPDSYVSLLGELISTKAADRQNAAALSDAATRLMEFEKAPPAEVTAPENLAASSIRPAARKADTASELALLEAALKHSAGHGPAWIGVRDLAVANRLTIADKRRWADVLIRLGAKKYPDFTLAVLSPMIGTVADAKEQDQMWSNVFTIFQARSDLAANIRMQEAAMWTANNENDKAGICYMDVIQRYANAGPFVLDALKGAEKMLVSSKRQDKVVKLYELTWSRTRPPQEMAGQFMTQSNWYHVGKMYADKLKEAGDTAKADLVTAQLEKPATAAGK